MSSLRKKKVLFPRFGSQPSSSQREEPVWVRDLDRDRAERPAPPPGNKPEVGRRDRKPRVFLKVKLPKSNLQSKYLPASTRWILDPPTSSSTATETPGGQSQDAVSESAEASVFFFSQTSPEKPKNDKDKAKLAVLKTISRMLEENQLIRSRLVALTQPS